MRWRRLGSALLIASALAAISGCAEQRDPIDRVEAFALPKALFSGEWFYQQTVVDVPATYTSTMVGNTNYRGMHRIRWDIQENYLYARKSYMNVINGKSADDLKPMSEDTGEFKGDIVGAWRITSQFDIKRSYNPQTGEENNVLTENSSDCKWYECQYLRVDWSKNYAIDYMFLSSDEEVIPQSVPFYEQDAADPRWKPMFDMDAGYIDFTSSMALDPGFTKIGSRSYPTCWLFANAHASCNTQIIKLRNSFLKRASNRDYEPREHKAPFDEWFGFFRQERHVWENRYGLNQKSIRKVINRHNLFTQHHYDPATDADKYNVSASVYGCSTDKECKTGSRCDTMMLFHKVDVDLDTDADGLPDSFEKSDVMAKAGLDATVADSDGDGVLDKSDDGDGNGVADIMDYWAWNKKGLHHRCTVPMNQRVAKPVAYFNTGFFPRDLTCDKDDKSTSGDCAPWKFIPASSAVDAATKRTSWGMLHNVSNDYDDTFWKIFLRGVYGWDNASFQKWLMDKSSKMTGLSATQRKQLEMFGDAKNGYHAFTICPNNPVAEADPWPCRFNHHSFAQAKELMAAGLKFNHLSYKQAKQMLDDGKKDALLKRSAIRPFIRHGDIRYSMVHYVKDFYDGWRLLGLGPSHTDPRTGENLAGVANMYALNDWAATYIQEMVQLINGDISSKQFINGVNLDNWIAKTSGTASETISTRTFSGKQMDQMYSSMVQPWMKKVPRTGSPALLKQMINKGNQKYVRREMLKRLANSGMFDPSRKAVDISAIKGTMLERRMVDSDILMAAGYPPASVKYITTEVLNKVSPARNGGMLQYLEDQEEWKYKLSNERNMYFMSMADDAMVGLAWRLAQKYKEKTPAERANMYWLEARDSIMRAVTTHEMGHTVGLHHNWGGSEDVMNFFPEYWTVRTNDGKDTKMCSNWKNAKAGDGQLCPFFVKNKAMTDFQLGKDKKNLPKSAGGKGLDSLYEYAYSSVMDYAGKYTIDGNGLGRYDKAALMYGHADKMEAFINTGKVPKGDYNPLTNTRANIFEEWSDRDGSVLIFTSYGPSSYHYTNWYAQMGKTLYQESNRKLLPYDKFQQYCYLNQSGNNKGAPVPCSTLKVDERRDVGYFYPEGNKALVRVPYIFCTYTRGNISDGCNTRDIGSDQFERMNNHITNWDTWYVLKNFTRYQFPWDASKFVSRNYRRTYKVLKNFNNLYALYQGLFRQWFPESMLQTFFTDPIWGWGAYTVAMTDAFNMAMRTLAMPDVKQFEKGTWADGQKVYKEAEYRVDFRSDLSNARFFATSWWDTNNQDACGLSFWECLHHVGFYLDKMMAMTVIADPQTYFTARDTAEDIRKWRISFFDNFSTQIVDFFGAMLSEDFNKFSPYFDTAKPYQGKVCTSASECGKGGTCDKDPANAAQKICNCKGQSCMVGDTNGNRWINGMAWRNYSTPSMDVQPGSTATPVEASTRFTLQIYAVVYGMLQFQQNFDNEFVARGRMWKKGTKSTWDVKPSKKITGVLSFSDPYTGATYQGVGYVDNRGIAQRMIVHANKIKSRTSYCTAKVTPPADPVPEDLCSDGVSATEQTAAEAELYKYTQLLDILVQVTSIYDNVAKSGQNWSDDYEDP